VTRDLLDYRLPALTDTPRITVELLGRPTDPIYGLGETAVPPVAPAVAAAVADAPGVVVTDLPLRPERVLAGLRTPTTGQTPAVSLARAADQARLADQARAAVAASGRPARTIPGHEEAR
jgi:hypothetical protein